MPFIGGPYGPDGKGGNLRGATPRKGNAAFSQAAQDTAQERHSAPQVRINKSGQRSAQGAAWRAFILEREAGLYSLSRKGQIGPEEYTKAHGDLDRIRDKGIESMSEWVGDWSPNSEEFKRAASDQFNALKKDLKFDVEIVDVPEGPITAQETEPVSAPENFKLSDLTPVVQQSNTGPLNEASVLEVGLKELDLPVAEVIAEEEDSGETSGQ